MRHSIRELNPGCYLLLRPSPSSLFSALSISRYSDLGFQVWPGWEFVEYFRFVTSPGQVRDNSLRLPKKWFWPCLNPRVYFPCNKILMKIYNCENHHLMTGAHSRFSCSWNKIFVRRLQAFQPDHLDSKTGQKLIQFPPKVSFCNFSVFNQHGNCTSKMHRSA